MKAARSIHFFFVAFAAIQFSACSRVQVTHVPPGKSARAVLAEKEASQQALAATPPPQAMPTPAATAHRNPVPEEQLPQLSAGNTSVPNGVATSEKVAESYSRGTFAMQAGQSGEAIAALEETVKLDPDFTDAWGKLAILYQKQGQSAKATDAFKMAKRLGDANGGTVSRDAAGGLQFP